MVKVRESAVIDAPVDAVWRVLRDFNSHVHWHPAIAESMIESGMAADEVGAVRRFRLTDGGLLREQLLSLDDERRQLSYCLLDSPLPLMNYVASIRLQPVTDTDRTFWVWESSFDPPAGRRDELRQLVADGIYRAGFSALETYLHPARSRQTDARSPPSGYPWQRRTENNPPRTLTETRPDVPVPGYRPVHAPATPETSEAIVIDRYGSPDVLRLRDVDVPAPGPGQVRIRQSFIGVNFIDVYCRTGYFDLLEPPGIPGMEAAGIVEHVGDGVDHLAPGDRVAYACPPVGAYARLRTMDAELVVRLPAAVSEEIAASALLKGIAAGFLLHDVHQLKRGETVLIHAAAGGIGSILVQWAASVGARVIATVSTRQKADIAARLGASHVIVHEDRDFADAVADITGGTGADVIYDAIGRDSFERSLRALAVRGHLVSYGQASGPIGEWDIGGLASKSVTLSRPNYGHYIDTRAKMAHQSGRLFDAMERGIVTIATPTRYKLADAASAHRDLETRRTTGSIVLTGSDD